MKRFVIENFPDDLARRMSAYLAAHNETRRDFIVRLVEKAVPETFTVKKETVAARK
jgi:hypothetical protein